MSTTNSGSFLPKDKNVALWSSLTSRDRNKRCRQGPGGTLSRNTQRSRHLCFWWPNIHLTLISAEFIRLNPQLVNSQHQYATTASYFLETTWMNSNSHFYLKKDIPVTNGPREDEEDEKLLSSSKRDFSPLRSAHTLVHEHTKNWWTCAHRETCQGEEAAGSIWWIWCPAHGHLGSAQETSQHLS